MTIEQLCRECDFDASVARAGYRYADLDALLGQLDRRAQRLSEVLVALDDGARQRTVRLDGATVPVDRVAHIIWHECLHNRSNIRPSFADAPIQKESSK